MGALFSSRKTRIHFPTKPIDVTVHSNPSDPAATVSQSLTDTVLAKCPSLFREFTPAWWLFNGHLQTVYCVMGDFSKIDKVHYKRTLLSLRDGGTLGLDFAPIDAETVAEDAPILVVQHGLTGGSYESYVRSIVDPACTPKEMGGLGWRAVVINFRGCAGVPITSQQIYSAGHTDDLRQALMYISHKYPRAPLLGIGFSLGANVLVRYLAEEGHESRIIGACALACPWNLRKNNDVLNSTFIGREIYAKSMGGNLLRLVKRNIQALSVDPDHYISKALPSALAFKSTPTLGSLDQAFTRIAGGSPPTFPFPSANAYYDWASSHIVVKDVKVPLLAMNSADDPVVQDVPMDAGGNPYAIMVVTPGGGHLGWFESQGTLGVARWIKKPVLEWFTMLIDDLVLEYPRGRSVFVDEDGFLRDDGPNRLGCKEKKSGQIIDGTVGEGGILQGL